MTTLVPIPVKVTRYGCPHCGRTASRPVRTREHMARCWRNPEARGCKTCRHFEPYGPEWSDSCRVGVSLEGRPQCGTCHGTGQTFDLGTLGISECFECGGDGGEIRPGPIVHCDLWQPQEPATETSSDQGLTVTTRKPSGSIR